MQVSSEIRQLFPGDIVKLATGDGPLMVVERFSRNPFNPEPVYVAFWRGGFMDSAAFAAKALRHATALERQNGC